jgi:hypothetical protein
LQPAHHRLATVYLLNDDLKSLWDYRYPRYPIDLFCDWYARTIRSRVEPQKSFARRRDKIARILARCEHPVGGHHEEVRVVSQMAYVFADDQYFSLRIRAALPAIRG